MIEPSKPQCARLERLIDEALAGVFASATEANVPSLWIVAALQSRVCSVLVHQFGSVPSEIGEFAETMAQEEFETVVKH